MAVFRREFAEVSLPEPKSSAVSNGVAMILAENGLVSRTA